MNESFSTLSFTDAALVQIRQIMIENGAYSAKLRVSASGGGCSGFQYAFSFVGDAADDDFQMEQGGVPVVVDLTSMQILSGAEIDCVENAGASILWSITLRRQCPVTAMVVGRCNKPLRCGEFK